MKYTVEDIRALSKWINNDTKAFNYLMEKGYRELVLIKESLEGRDEVEKWLFENNHKILASFLDAVSGNLSAAKFLVKNEPILAATAGMVNGDKMAEAWLRKNKLDHFVELGKAIIDKFNGEKMDFSVLYKGPFG